MWRIHKIKCLIIDIGVENISVASVLETEMVRLLQLVHLGQEAVAQKDELILNKDELIRQKDEAIHKKDELIKGHHLSLILGVNYDVCLSWRLSSYNVCRLWCLSHCEVCRL